jgi:hypothetical protein
MPPKVPYYTENQVRSAALPNHGGRYAVVPHGDVIDNVKAELKTAGFTIKNEYYKLSNEGNIAQGVYHLDYGNDPDMGMMFAWSNSYNKTMRFKCGIGAHVFVCMNGVLRGDMGSYSRKHSGTALQDVVDQIKSQIQGAKEYYDKLLQDKAMLKNVLLSPRDKGRILGQLFANDEILTLTQVGIVKREIDKPSHSYNCHTDSAWAMYNHITFALKESHPSTYMSDHEKVHHYFVDAYGISVIPQATDPGSQSVDDDYYPDSPIAQEEEENVFGVNFV